jgi:hypothetical protein
MIIKLRNDNNADRYRISNPLKSCNNSTIRDNWSLFVTSLAVPGNTADDRPALGICNHNNGTGCANLHRSSSELWIICVSIVPILGALLQIWAPKYQKYHNRAVLAVFAIWIATTLLGPNEEFIMVMVIPWILVFGVLMLATFAITWKTGRLKEVRSDLMIVSIIFGMASQSLRVPLLGSAFFYVPDVFFMLSMLFIAIAFGNPWFRRELNGKESTPPPREIEVAVEY